MRIEQEVKAFIAALISLMAVFLLAYPMVQERKERFVELGIIGPDGEIGNLKHIVHPNQTLNLYLYLGNREGKTRYYFIVGKIRRIDNQTDTTYPFDGDVFIEQKIILGDGLNKTIPVSFKVPGKNGLYWIIFELYSLDPSESRPNFTGVWVGFRVKVSTGS